MKPIIVLDLLYYDVDPLNYRNGVTPTALEEASHFASQRDVYFGCAGSNLPRLKKAFPSIKFVNLAKETYETHLIHRGSVAAAKNAFVPEVVDTVRRLVDEVSPVAISAHSQTPVISGLAKAELPIPVISLIHFYPMPNPMFHAGLVSKRFEFSSNKGVFLVANSEYTRKDHQRVSTISYNKGFLDKTPLFREMKRRDFDYFDHTMQRMVCSTGLRRDMTVKPNGRFHVASRIHKEKELPFCSSFGDSVDFSLIRPETLDDTQLKILSVLDTKRVQFNVSHDKLMTKIQRYSGNIVSCPFETFARTAFEAACVGVPSILFTDASGDHAVDSWMSLTGFTMPRVNIRDRKSRKDSMHAAMETLNSWSMKKRGKLAELMNSEFSSEAFLKERSSIIKLAQQKMYS